MGWSQVVIVYENDGGNMADSEVNYFPHDKQDGRVRAEEHSEMSGIGTHDERDIPSASYAP